MATETKLPLLLSEARTLLGGYVPQDTDFETAINEAVERIYSEGIWDGVTDRLKKKVQNSTNYTVFN